MNTWLNAQHKLICRYKLTYATDAHTTHHDIHVT